MKTAVLILIIAAALIPDRSLGVTILPSGQFSGAINNSLEPHWQSTKQNLGYVDGDLWLKYEVKVKSDPVFISILNPLYENVSLYQNKKLLKPIRIFPFYTYALDGPGESVIIKVNSGLIIDTSIEVSSFEEFLSLSFTHTLLLLGYSCFIGIFILVTAFFAIRRRSTLLVNYALVIASFHGLAVLSLFAGPLTSHYFPSFLDRPVFLSVVISEFVACLACTFFIYNVSGRPKEAKKSKTAIGHVVAAGVLITLFVQNSAGALLALILSIYTLVFGIKFTLGARKRDKSLENYVFAWSAISFGVFSFISQYVGLFPNYGLRYYMFVGAMLEVSLVGSIVYEIISKKEEGLRFMQFSLSGMISDSNIAAIAQKDSKLALETTVEDVTVMITDIKDFSRLAEGRSDLNRFFAALTKYNSTVSSIVHQHGGIVNKSVGDSLICYFGYSLTGERTIGHAQAAVECALQIQRALVHMYLNEDAPFPTRIGIDAGKVSMGNVNPQGGIDFTMIGNTVNMAKRYETACEPFYVLVSDEVKKRVHSKEQVFEKKFLYIKNSTSLVLGWELDPFVGQNTEHYDIKNAQIRLNRKGREFAEETVQCLEEINFTVRDPLVSKLRVKNYSLNGMAVQSSVHLSREITLKGEIEGQTVVAKIVRVEKHPNNTYLLGVNYTNLTKEGAQQLLELLNYKSNTSVKKIA